MRVYILLACFLGGLLAGGFGAWQVQDWRHDAAEATRLQKEADASEQVTQQVDQAAARHEAKKTEIETQFLVITERIHDVQSTPFYAAGAPACLDDDGVRLVNEAAAVPAASQPAPSVPAPAAAEGRRAGDRVEVDDRRGEAVRDMSGPAPQDGGGLHAVIDAGASRCQLKVQALCGVRDHLAIQPSAVPPGRDFGRSGGTPLYPDETRS